MEEKNNYNLFNFDGMSEVANNLIDKLASATGWYVSRNTPSKIGLNTYIEYSTHSEPHRPALRATRSIM